MNKRLIDTFVELVSIDSESTNEKNFALHLEKQLKELGFQTSFDQTEEETGCNIGNLYAKRDGHSNLPIIAFSMHMDTVTPGVGIRPIIHEDRVTSDGTTILASDDKAPIACLLEALRQLKEDHIETRPLELVFSVREEGGLLGAKSFDVGILESKEMYIMDSSGRPGKAIIQAPAQDKLTATIVGKAAHAGIAPERGINAIQVMSHAISRMNLLRIDTETTANVGIITGGNATNVVTEKCTAYFEARSLNEAKLEKQMNHMKETLVSTAKEFSATVEIDHTASHGSFQAASDSPIVKRFLKVCEKNSLPGELTSTGGGSDANIYSKKGLDVIVLSVGMTEVHSTNEYILIEDLDTVTQITKDLILESE